MTPDIRLGFTAALGAYLLWGFLPLYFKLLGHVDAQHMLAHRILWSVPTGFILVMLARKWRDVSAAFSGPRVWWLLLTSALIATNWCLYIWAVGEERVMEASLGYFINPLVNVLVGSIFLSETLRRWQWIAVGLATIGVVIEAFALGYLPWISLTLCATFAAYSIIRKRLDIDGRAGFVIEVILLAPIALIWMVFYVQAGNPIAGRGGWDWGLLALSGPITAIPLILFAVGAKRLRFSTIGMMQYIAPTIQFLLALSFGESFTLTHAIAFGFIWSALIVFTTDSLAADQRGRRAARAAASLGGNKLPETDPVAH